jgi:DNA-binding SARP family transcriptional activator
MEHNAERPHISLLPRFCLRTGDETAELTEHQQILLAALALERGPVEREHVAEQLWPDASTTRANARLRQILWRIGHTTAEGVVRITKSTLALEQDVQVDYLRALHGTELIAAAAARTEEVAPEVWQAWQHPLLAAWDFEWLRPLQEQWDLLRVQAMEAMAQSLLRRRQYAAVLVLADAATRADPLKETPRRIAIQSCLSVGETADAHRRYLQYRKLLREELGISPSVDIQRMLRRAREGSLRLGEAL